MYAIANDNPGWAWVDTGYNAPLNQWTHLAITYDGSAINTYANGQLQNSLPGSGNIGDVVPGQNQLRIGWRQAGFDNLYKGEIDDVRIWNVARSGGEISTNFSQSLTGNEANLVGYYTFDNATASNSASTGTTNNGTLVNGATTVPSDRHQPVVSISGFTPVIEENSPFLGYVDVTLDRPVTVAPGLTLNYTLGGTATQGEDFYASQLDTSTIDGSPPIHSIFIPQGERTARINVAALPDAIQEGNESIQIKLVNPTLSLDGIDDFELSEGRMVAQGGFDMLSGLALESTFYGSANGGMVTALTSLKHQLMASGLAADEADVTLSEVLDLPEGVDLDRFNAVGEILQGNDDALAVYANHIKIYGLFNLTNQFIREFLTDNGVTVDAQGLEQWTTRTLAAAFQQVGPPQDAGNIAQYGAFLMEQLEELVPDDSTLPIDALTEGLSGWAIAATQQFKAVNLVTEDVVLEEAIETLNPIKIAIQRDVADLMGALGRGDLSAGEISVEVDRILTDASPDDNLVRGNILMVDIQDDLLAGGEQSLNPYGELLGTLDGIKGAIASPNLQENTADASLLMNASPLGSGNAAAHHPANLLGTASQESLTSLNSVDAGLAVQGDALF